VEAMAIPHKTAPYEQLRLAVALPAPVAAEPDTPSRSRSRRPQATPT
jgi:hypothetical protein